MGPEVRYTRSGDSSIAYQVMGDGPMDVAFLPEWFNNLEMHWEDPRLARFPTRLASFGRVMMLNMRGMGLSDPIPNTEPPTVERWMDDISAVMDAVGSQRVAMVGTGLGGAVAMVFAATYPQRASALVLVNSTARSSAAPDYPFGIDHAWRERTQDSMRRSWGRAPILEWQAPELAGDARFKEWWARFERYAASPGVALAVLRMVQDLDVRHVLPSIQCPVLVLHRAEDPITPVDHGRYLAEHIPGARYVEVEGRGHAYWSGDTERLLVDIQEFLTGAPATLDIDRVLATVMFTDIVGSTELVSRLGDSRWTALLDEHRILVRRELDRFRGREVDTAGDGFLATFDGPARAIQCAAAVRDAVDTISLRVRTGLHTGEIETRAGGIAGIAVHIAARVAAAAEPDEILVSRTVVDLVAGSRILFADRGDHTLKGVPGEWQLFAVEEPARGAP